jgi:hypothetical protein
MSATYASRECETETETDLYLDAEALVRKNPWTWQSVCAVLGLAGGLAAPVLGAAADVVTWVVHAQPVNTYLHAASIVSCALTLPLLILGALCLDSLETKAGKLAPAGRT